MNVNLDRSIDENGLPFFDYRINQFRVCRSAFDSGFHGRFLGGDRQECVNSIGEAVLRDDNHAVVIADDQVTGIDEDAAKRDRQADGTGSVLLR